VGNDDFSDGESAGRYGIDHFVIYGAWELRETLGNLGLDVECPGIGENVKIGLLTARLFNDPFCFENKDGRLTIEKNEDIGYVFMGPLIVDFVLWLKKEIEKCGISEMLFGARDGFLIQKVFDLLNVECENAYFLTSRTAAIRAGIESEGDLSYVRNMKFSGSESEAIKARFDTSSESEALALAKERKENYIKYVRTLGLRAGKTAFFDLVAKGTTQLFLQKILGVKLQGLYFMQLEPEAMKEYDLKIDSFYFCYAKENSALFDLYYLLETVLTAPHPQVQGFDGNGEPEFAEETRTADELKCISEVQAGILEYAKDYFSIVGDNNAAINIDLDEKILGLITKISIENEVFLNLTVEDPFFNRMTPLKDIIC
jgi:hypothetical protein